MKKRTQDRYSEMDVCTQRLGLCKDSREQSVYDIKCASFPAQNGECFENVRDKSHSLDDREHGCPILSQPEGTECAS